MASQKRIAIIGAGAAGISAAYFLQKKGYTHIVVFEKTDQVGGKCRSFTYHGKTYEEGAFTVTRNYEEVKKLISKLHFHLCNPPHRKIMEPGKKKLKQLHQVFAAKFSRFLVLGAAMRYFREIYRSRYLAKPGFAKLDPALSQPFAKWAQERNMGSIVPLFVLPISLFGYGDLNVIPAAYVLKYIRFWNFVAMLLIFLFGKLGTKRIVEGYGRIWEHLSHRIDIRLKSNIEKIERKETILIHFEHRDPLEFDELIIACSLHDAVKFLDLSKEETELFSKVKTYDYYVTVFKAKKLPNNCLYSIPLPEKGHAYMIYKPWKEHDLYVAYSFAERGFSIREISRLLEDDIHALGGELTHIEETIHWEYFPHVSSEEIANGFYDKVEALQGKWHTYYTGASLSFETVENVVKYSKALVEKEF